MRKVETLSMPATLHTKVRSGRDRNRKTIRHRNRNHRVRRTMHQKKRKSTENRRIKTTQRTDRLNIYA